MHFPLIEVMASLSVVFTLMFASIGLAGRIRVCQGLRFPSVCQSLFASRIASFELAFIHHLKASSKSSQKLAKAPSGLVPADQVKAAARASTCAYATVASKFVTNYRVDKSKEGSPRSYNIITAILEPTILFGVVAGDTLEYL